MLSLFDYEFMVHAFEAGTVAAIVAACVGWFVVLRGDSFSAHTLAVRPVVLPPDADVAVRAEDAPEELLVTIDGQVGTTFAPGHTLMVRRADRPVLMMQFRDTTFFSRMRRKLAWGGLPERDESDRC